MNLIGHAACVILLVSTPLATVGQNITEKKLSTDPQAKPAAEQKKALDATERKILSVLNQILELQTRFADENVRLGVQAEIADLLWNYDQPRARTLLEGAFQALVNAKPAYRSPGPIAPLRFPILQTIARRDPGLALTLQQSLEIPPNTDVSSTYIYNTLYGDRARLQNDLALFIFIGEAQSPTADVQRLTQAVKPFAERGDLKRLIPFLRQIRSKDVKVADDLFAQALEKAKLGQPDFFELRSLAGYPFPEFGDGVISFSSGPRTPFEAIHMSQSLVQQVLDFVYDTVSRRLDASLAGVEGARLNPRAHLDYAFPRMLAPYFDQFMPDRAAAFRARVEEVRRRVRPEEQLDLTLSEPGTVAELLTRAAGLIEQRHKDYLYEKAAQQAMLTGNFDQAAAIIEKISDQTIRSSRKEEMFRERLRNDLFAEVRKVIERGNYDEAEQMISGIPDRTTRMWMFQGLVGAAIRKDKDRAAEILAGATRRTANIEDGVERGLQLISLARIAGSIDLNRGFDQMKIAIDDFNRAGIVTEWEKYEEIGTGSVGAGEKTTRSVNVGLSALLGNADFQWLGNMDFDRGLVLAQQVQVREASSILQLAVCRGALSKLQAATPKKSMTPEKPPEPKPKQP